MASLFVCEFRPMVILRSVGDIMRRALSIVGLTLGLSVLVIAFQNCGPDFKVIDPTVSGEVSQLSINNDDSNNDSGQNQNQNSGGSNSEDSLPPIPPLNKDLISISNLKYKGAFRVAVENDELGVNYSFGQIGYNPDNNSLFVVGHDYTQNIGQFVIPQPSTATNISQLPQVVIQKSQMKEILDASGVNNSQGVNRITGLLYVNNQLIVNAEVWYDGGGTSRASTLVVKDVKNFVSASVSGYYEMADGARAAGYMSEVPLEWREKVGSSYITGWSNVYSIISRYSVGPSMYSFNADALTKLTAKTGTIATKAIMSFPYGDGEFLAPNAADMYVNGPASKLYNALSRAVYGVIIPGTSTFAVFGSTAAIEGGLGYKITQDNGNVCGGPCPYLADDVDNYYWFFDMNEILSAPRVSAPRPYAYGKFNVPFDQSGRLQIGGGAYDSKSGLLYLSVNGADTVAGSRTPLIVSFSIEK